MATVFLSFFIIVVVLKQPEVLPSIIVYFEDLIEYSLVYFNILLIKFLIFVCKLSHVGTGGTCLENPDGISSANQQSHSH